MFQPYQTKPIRIKAIRLTDENLDYIVTYIKRNNGVAFAYPQYGLIETTHDGDAKAFVGDWIIQGIDNKFYPCIDKVFQEKYDWDGV